MSKQDTYSLQDLSHDTLFKKAQLIAPLWRKNLLSWYQLHGRHHLPWRNLTGIHAPYGVYVSEIMLQQTQVKRVLESYYSPFMAAFPTLGSLAYASEQSLLKLWQGLGYYTRVRNMHKSAQICLAQHKGYLPSTHKELLTLPGIGAYSAGAILCFGFLQATSFVDGNIARILSRAFALTHPTQKQLQALADILLDREQSFAYNQGLLDVGAGICTPKNTLCTACPFEKLCSGKEQPILYPTPKIRKLQPLELHLLFALDSQTHTQISKQSDKKIPVEKNPTYILLARSQNALYRGLYNLPLLSHKPKSEEFKLLGSFKHHYTKYNIRAFVYQATAGFTGHFSLCEENMILESVRLDKLYSKPLSSLCTKALKVCGIM